MSYYQELELTETATADEIKKAYRRLSMIYHPDKNNGNAEATAKFQRIGEAYETLKDVHKRRAYDMGGANQVLENVDVADIFSQMFGAMGNAGPGHGGIHGIPGIRIFHMGGGGFSSGGSGSFSFESAMQKPIPIIQHLVVPLDKVLTGTTVPVEIERWLNESGIKVFEKETIYVDIPQGVDEGEVIVLKEKGNVISDRVPPGDVKIMVKVENKTDFVRQGLDLWYEKTISLKEALCGCSFELNYLSGKVFNVVNHPGNIICPEYKKIIPQMGLARGPYHGNLTILFHVQFPDSLSEEVLEQLNRLL